MNRTTGFIIGATAVVSLGLVASARHEWRHSGSEASGAESDASWAMPQLLGLAGAGGLLALQHGVLTGSAAQAAKAGAITLSVVAAGSLSVSWLAHAWDDWQF